MVISACIVLLIPGAGQHYHNIVVHGVYLCHPFPCRHHLPHKVRCMPMNLLWFQWKLFPDKCSQSGYVVEPYLKSVFPTLFWFYHSITSFEFLASLFLSLCISVCLKVGTYLCKSSQEFNSTYVCKFYPDRDNLLNSQSQICAKQGLYTTD